MTHLSRLPYAFLLLTAVGCVGLPEPEKTPQVSGQFFEAPPAAMPKAQLPRPEDSLSVRVDFVGHKLVAANPQIGLRPLFAAAQSPTPEIFHVDRRFIYVTDGLVKQLPSEADLAAVLAFELARMVSEREARVRQDLKLAAARPPIQLPIGGTGPLAATDMVSTFEMAKYDKERRDLLKPSTKLHPETLARDYLESAGYSRTDFDRVQPILQAAEKNSALERHVRGLPAPSVWSR
jgi:predicted Zn-dependent protease